MTDRQDGGTDEPLPGVDEYLAELAALNADRDQAALNSLVPATER